MPFYWLLTKKVEARKKVFVLFLKYRLIWTTPIAQNKFVQKLPFLACNHGYAFVILQNILDFFQNLPKRFLGSGCHLVKLHDYIQVLCIRNVAK